MVDRERRATSPSAAAVREAERARSSPAADTGEKPEKAAKRSLTVHLPVELIDRVKNTVYWTPGLTLTGLAEEALRQVVDALEEQNGAAFPQRDEELRGGRPLK